ncbi:hypothetical protein [Duganella sp. Root1480D1]|uniref:hypothetical protein n=1 Tax=Duganella sp. Root1480D1 TaxID=1736471 RepID=UPI00070F2A0E|nr:hypothetical protein [Duganella sp. Root1480D1]KQZ42466.1 hypothetical protein ASD58_24145 [Duganella sp. Root1480D1]
MKKYQSGISLVTVAVIMGALGAVAVFALISMRQDRNLFAEGLNKVGAKAAEAAAPVVATVTPPAAPMRKCVINGQTVISNTDCGEKGKVIEIHDTRGIEAPKEPPKPPPAAMPSATERAIERATR